MAVIPFITGVTVVDIVLATTFLNLLFTFRDYRRRRGFPYPPGPKPWPIIGNLLDSPKQSQWTTYTEMSKKHGLCDVVAKWCTSFAETSFHIFQAKFCIFKYSGRQSWCSVPSPRSKTYSKNGGKSTRIVLLCRCIICEYSIWSRHPALLPFRVFS